MRPRDLPDRTRIFARDVITFVRTLQGEACTKVISYQLVKAGTSVGANCREASHALTRREFIHKIGIAQKECAESQYWLELCGDVAIGDPAVQARLLVEAGELLAILVTISTKAKRNDPGHCKPRS